MTTKKKKRTSEKQLEKEAALWDERKIDPKTWEDSPESLPRHDETEAISIRIPKLMLAIIKEFAGREGIGYQALMKKWIDEKILEERNLFIVSQRIKRGEPLGNITKIKFPKHDLKIGEVGHYSFSEDRKEA
ncbi:MAG: hypothetical protein HQK54_08370 [Oligoflexales bacterium]|nr:hypothetical protein [Oligoflexales bacterium]